MAIYDNYLDGNWGLGLIGKDQIVQGLTIEKIKTLSADWESEQTLRGKSIIYPIFVGILRSIELGASSEIEG